ncbi:MAG: 4Fe-4S dicluster domain-containing protein [Deltaproteobacteria bacterium]|nr:4Fe-4S dicluster domain-containing protein [Deltaproteobacteria bacterium]
MKADIERLVRQHGLLACFECGKCTASCPLGELFGDLDFGHTPRGIVEKALADADLVTGDAIWYCLTCDVCTKGCPCGVRLRDFVEALRRLAVQAGHDAHGVRCRLCGKYFIPDTTLKLLVGKLLGQVEPGRVAAPEYLWMCPRCRRRHFAHQARRGAPG